MPKNIMLAFPAALMPLAYFSPTLATALILSAAFAFSGAVTILQSKSENTNNSLEEKLKDLNNRINDISLAMKGRR